MVKNEEYIDFKNIPVLECNRCKHENKLMKEKPCNLCIRNKWTRFNKEDKYEEG